MIRSKSTGSFGEIKMGRFDSRKKAVKMPVVKLSKSRSMGILHSPQLLRYKNNIGIGLARMSRLMRLLSLAKEKKTK